MRAEPWTSLEEIAVTGDMEKLLKKKAIYALLYAATAVILEIISFSVMGLGVFPSFWGIDVAFILGVAVIIFIVPSEVASIVINGVLLFIQLVISFINEALYSMSGMVFSFNMLNLAKEVGGVFSSDFMNWGMLAGMLLLYGAELAGMILLRKHMRTPRVRFTKNAVILLLVCCIIGENAALILYHATIGTFQSTTSSDELSDYNDDELLYTTQFIPSKALKKFGFFGFYFMNASRTIGSLFGESDSDRRLELSALDNYFSDGEMSGSAYGDSIYTGSLYGKNIVLIVIESGEWYGINEEYTPTLYELATEGVAFTEYYARDKTNHSEALSVLGSYPVNNDPATRLKNSDLAFALPKLLGAAGYTSNYFHASTKSFYNRDVTYGGGGLFGFDTAHFLDDMPALDGCDEDGKIVKDDFYDFDKDAQVTENYFPEYTYKAEGDGAFFTMHMTLSSHGDYDDLIDCGDYPFREDWYYDSDMTEEERAAEQERLKAEFSERCTVKGFEKFYEIIDGYPETFVAGKGILLDTDPETSAYSPQMLEEIYLRYKRYQAGLMDLDEAVNSLIYDLQRTGQLDDTAFVFYADHSAYYSNQHYYLKGVPVGDNWNTALYNLPCFLWYGGSMDCEVTPPENFYEDYHSLKFTATADTDSPLQGGMTIDKFCNSFDILPTLLHLVGFDYNLNLYQGVSIFSDRTSVFVSRESGIFTGDIYYDGITVSVKEDDGTWTQYDYESTLYSDEGFPAVVTEFLKNSLRYYEKQEMLEEMYRLDYFSRRPVFGNVVKDGKVFRYVRLPEGEV